MRKKAKTKQQKERLAFPKILQKIKKERNLSVRALAAMADVGESVMQGWLNGSHPHDLSKVAKLAEALGVSFRFLLLGQEEANMTATKLDDLFLEEEWFEGICKVSIKRLKPKKGVSNDG